MDTRIPWQLCGNNMWLLVIGKDRIVMYRNNCGGEDDNDAKFALSYSYETTIHIAIGD